MGAAEVDHPSSQRCGPQRRAQKSEKHGSRCVGGSDVRGNRIRGADLDDVVAEEHDLEEEGDNNVGEDDRDDEHSAHARVRLKK